MTFEQLEGIIDVHGTAIYNFCRYLTYTREDADDLYQDTFMYAVKNSTKINIYDNPKSFLISVAIRLWKSGKRKYAKRNLIAQFLPLEDAEKLQAEESTEQTYLIHEQAEYIRQECNQLPDKYRLPIYLYYTLEYSIADIGCFLRIPEGTVKSRLYKARQILAKRLEVVGYVRP